MWTPFARTLSLIAATALAWRLIYVQLELPYHVLTDEAWYIAEAQRLFGPHAWTNVFDLGAPSAQHGPLTSVIVSPFAWLFPHALVGLRNVMALVGTLTVVMMGFAGRELGGDRVGLIAAGAAAVFPDFWIRDGLVVSEPVATLLVVAAVWLALRCRAGVTQRRAIGFGVLAGLVCLARPEIVLALVVIAGIVIVRHGAPHRWRTTVLMILALVAVITPWWAYNAARFNDPVVLSNNLGITLAGANCARTYYDAGIMGYDSPKCWTAAFNRASAQSGDESVQSSLMTHEAVSYALHHLDRIPAVVVMREVWFLGVYRPGWVAFIGSGSGQPTWATWLQAVAFWFIFPAAMAAWWLNRRRSWPHWLFAVLILNSLLVAALFVGHWRYRITLDVAVVLLLALAADEWWVRHAAISDTLTPCAVAT